MIIVSDRREATVIIDVTVFPATTTQNSMELVFYFPPFVQTTNYLTQRKTKHFKYTGLHHSQIGGIFH